MAETTTHGILNTTQGNISSTPRAGKARRFPERLQQILDAIKDECRRKHASTPAKYEGQVYCNRTIDAWGGCWEDTPAGARASIRCPAVPLFNTNGFASRECTVNGTWYVNASTGSRWANYTECLQTQIEEDNTYIYIFIGGFSLSLLLLAISLGIFFKFRQLRCDRITIHKNLFLSYVFTGLTWILYYVLVTLDGDVILENPVWCQALHVLCQYCMVGNFMWMFCEGLYLNTIMVYAFSSGKALIITCHIVGWGLPIILSAVYAGIRSSSELESLDCWFPESNLQWIMYGPVVFSIVVNMIFLINIVRLLITKLRQMPEASQTSRRKSSNLVWSARCFFAILNEPNIDRKATRATLILVPLLGLQYLLIPIKPNPGSNLEEVYHVFVALLISLQGAFVSIIYCFCNGEVLAVMRRKWNQHQLMKGNSMRSSTHGATTTYTTIDPVTQANATSYFSTANNKKIRLKVSKTRRKKNGTTKTHYVPPEVRVQSV